MAVFGAILLLQATITAKCLNSFVWKKIQTEKPKQRGFNISLQKVLKHVAIVSCLLACQNRML
jgi:hypothetical protein